MKRLIFILLTILLFVSCHKDETIEPDINDDYALVIKNATHDELMVESEQLSTGIIVLQSGEATDIIYSSSDKITISYFGKGTYYKQKDIEISLDIGVVANVVLTN